MTLPVNPNPISISQISTEIGVSSTTSQTMSYLNGLIKPAQRPSSPNMDSFRGKTYYQRNVDGNCTVNCPSDCNCGVYDSGVNCIISGPVNCINCDTQNWLQTNCNCVSPTTTFNCTYGTYSYDCEPTNCSS